MQNHPFFINKEVRRQQRLAQFSKVHEVLKSSSAWDTRDRLKGEGNGAPQNVVLASIQRVSEYIDQFEWPLKPILTYSGIKKATYEGNDSRKKILDGIIMITAKIKTITGAQKEASIPVMIKEGKPVDPSVLFVDGTMRVMGQSTINDIVDANTLSQGIPDRRNMYSPNQVEKSNERVPVSRPGIFSVGSANRELLKKVLRGEAITKNAQLIGKIIDVSIVPFAPPIKAIVLSEKEPDSLMVKLLDMDITSGLVEGDVVEVEDFQGDWMITGSKKAQVEDSSDSHLDIVEQDQSEWLKPGDRVETTRGKRCKNRGGGSYVIPKGTTGVVKEDVAGDGHCLKVKLDISSKLVVFKSKELKKVSASKKGYLIGVWKVQTPGGTYTIEQGGPESFYLYNPNGLEVEPYVEYSSLREVALAITDKTNYEDVFPERVSSKSRISRTAQSVDSILDEIRDMNKEGYGALDILLAVKKKYGEDLGGQALSKAKQENLLSF